MKINILFTKRKKFFLFAYLLFGALITRAQSTDTNLTQQVLNLKPGALSSVLIKSSLNLQNKFLDLRQFQNHNPLLAAAYVFGGWYAGNAIAKHLPLVSSLQHSWKSFTLGSYGQKNGFLSEAGKWTGLLTEDLPTILLAEGAINYALQVGLGGTSDEIKNILKPLIISTYLLTKALPKRQLMPVAFEGIGGDTRGSSLAEGVYRSSTYIPKGVPSMTPGELIASCSEPKLKEVVYRLYKNPQRGGRLLLIGDSGLGKTFWAEQLANTLERNAVYLNANEALYQGKFYGEANEKFKALFNIAEHYNLKKGDVVIIDEIDNFIVTSAGFDENNQNNIRKNVMLFLDHMQGQGYVIIFISNKKEAEIQEQVRNRFSRSDGSLHQYTEENYFDLAIRKATEGARVAKKGIAQSLKAVFTPEDTHIKGFSATALGGTEDFPFGIVEKGYPNLLARMQICDNVISKYRENGGTTFIKDQAEFTSYIAHRTDGLGNTFVAGIVKYFLANFRTIDLEDENFKKAADEETKENLQDQKGKLEQAYQKSYAALSNKVPRAEWKDIFAEGSASSEKQVLLKEVLMSEHRLKDFCAKFSLGKPAFHGLVSTRSILSSLRKEFESTLQKLHEGISTKRNCLTQLLKEDLIPRDYSDIYREAKELAKWSQQPTLFFTVEKDRTKQYTPLEIYNFIRRAVKSGIKKQLLMKTQDGYVRETNKKTSAKQILDIQVEKMNSILTLVEVISDQYPDEAELEGYRAKAHSLLDLLSQLGKETPYQEPITQKISSAEEEAVALYQKYFAFAPKMEIWQAAAIGRKYAYVYEKDYKCVYEEDKDAEFAKLVLDEFGVNALFRNAPAQYISKAALTCKMINASAKHTLQELGKVIRPARYERTVVSSQAIITQRLQTNGLEKYLGTIVEKTATLSLAEAAAHAKYIKETNKNIGNDADWEKAKKFFAGVKDIFFGPENKLMVRYLQDEKQYVLDLETYLTSTEKK